MPVTFVGTVRFIVRSAWRVTVLCVGVGLMVLGLALIVLPGPFTVPLLLAGLAVLATQFAWARWVLNRARYQAKQAQIAARARMRRRQRAKAIKLHRKRRVVR